MMTTAQLWQLAGWTMIHFLWIGAALTVATAILRFPLRRRAPALRYAVTLTCFLAITAAPIVIAAWLWNFAPPEPTVATLVEDPQGLASSPASANPQAETIDLAATPIVVESGNETLSQTAPAPPSTATLASSPAPESPPAPFNYRPLLNRVSQWLPWVWIIGAPLTFLLLTTGLIGVERLRRHATPITTGPVYEKCARLRTALRLSKRVTVAMSDKVVQPVLVGIVRPLILLPPAALSGWSPEQLEMALLHELAHVRRWDNLVNLFQRLIESVLFFHPAVWLVSRWLRADREQCCDAIVVRHTEAPEAYADLLLSVAAKTQAIPFASSALARHPLARRIRRILQLEDDPMLVSRSMLGLVGATLVAVVSLALWQGQPKSIAEEPPREPGALATGEIEETTEDTEITKKRTLNSFEMSFAIAGEPKVFPDPATGKNWQTTQIALARSPVVLEQAIKNLEDGATFQAPTVKWLLANLDVSYGQDQNLRFEVSSNRHSRDEMRAIAVAVAESYLAERNRQAKHATDSPFLPLEQQRIADLAYGMLHVEIAPLDKELLSAVKEKEFNGGVLIDYVKTTQLAGRGSVHHARLQKGDILVGLHVWPTADFGGLAEVLRRDDLMEFSPLKYFVLRPVAVAEAQEDGFGRGGEFGRGRAFSSGREESGRGFGRGGRDGGRLAAAGPGASIARTKLQLITGRITIPPAAWQAEQQRLERLSEANAPNFRHIGGGVGVPMEQPKAPHTEELGPNHPKKLLLERERESRKRLEEHSSKQLLYDGRTFDQWRTQWKTELKTEKRTEAIRALAAFGRAGYGKKAAEAILDVAGEYDFRYAVDAEAELYDAITGALYRSIPPKTWLPMLDEKYAANPRLWEPIVLGVVTSFHDDDLRSAKIELLLHIARDDASRRSGEAMLSLVRIDPQLEHEGIRNQVKKFLLDPELSVRVLGIQALFQAENTRGMIDDLIRISSVANDDLKKRFRRELHRANHGAPAQEVLQSMTKALDALATMENTAENTDKSLYFIRNIAAIGRTATSARKSLDEIVQGANPRLQVAAAVAIQRITSGSTQAVPLLRANLAGPEGDPLSPQEIQELVSEERALFPNH